MKMFCIGLKRSVKRRSRFLESWVGCLNFNVSFFDAVDKYLIKKDEIENAERELNRLSFSPAGIYGAHKYSFPGILACSLSHLSLLSSIQDQVDEEGVVVFEDDVIPMDGAEYLEERIELVRQKFPQVEAIVCNRFDGKMVGGLQTLGKRVLWDESTHTPIPNARASIVKIAPGGSFFVWYSQKGVSRMVSLIQGREFLSVDLFYGVFAHHGVLAMLSPGIGYHPSGKENESEISTPPFTMKYAN